MTAAAAGVAWQALQTHLVGVIKELQDGEDAGADEQTHLTPDVTCNKQRERERDWTQHSFTNVYQRVVAMVTVLTIAGSDS